MFIANLRVVKGEFMRLPLIAVGVLFLVSLSTAVFGIGTSSGAPGLIQGIDRLPLTEIEPLLPNAYPTNYYAYAQRLWVAGDKDKALLWFCIGQLRFRFLLAARARSAASGDAALFESLQATVGEPMADHARSNPKRWSEQIEGALRWDATHANGITSQTTYRQQWEQVRAGLMKLRTEISAHAGEIQSQNAQRREAQQGEMPIDWPHLNDTTTTDQLTGAYQANWHLGHSLFLGDGSTAAHATTYELRRDGGDGLLMIAKRGEQELVRKTVTVREQNGAIVFEEDVKGTAMNTGSVHEVVQLRLNAMEELVVRSAWRIDSGEQPPLWFRAARMSPP